MFVKVSVPVPVTIICVVISPLFISANIGKPILVSDLQFLLFLMLLYKVYMFPVYPFAGLFVETSVGHFLTNCQTCYVMQLIYVNCVYIVLMFVI